MSFALVQFDKDSTVESKVSGLKTYYLTNSFELRCFRCLSECRKITFESCVGNNFSSKSLVVEVFGFGPPNFINWKYAGSLLVYIKMKKKKKIDGVGSVDNRPSTDKLHRFVKKKMPCDM